MSLCWLHLCPVSNVTVCLDRLPGHQLHVYSIILIDTPPSACMRSLWSLHSPNESGTLTWSSVRMCVYGCVFYTLALLSPAHWSRFYPPLTLRQLGAAPELKNKQGAL